MIKATSVFAEHSLEFCLQLMELAYFGNGGSAWVSRGRGRVFIEVYSYKIDQISNYSLVGMRRTRGSLVFRPNNESARRVLWNNWVVWVGVGGC